MAIQLQQPIPGMAAGPAGSPRLRGLGGGMFAGFVGGAVLAMYMMAMNLIKGQDIWIGAKLAGWPFLGDAAMAPGFSLGPVLVGLLSHFAVSLVWGALFGLLCIGRSRGATLALGALWGIVVWLGMFYVLLPFIGAGQMTLMMPVGAAIFEHVLFGLAVAVAFLPYQPRATQPPTPAAKPI